MTKSPAIILDLDGTLVDDSHRLRLINGFDYDDYHRAMVGDTLNTFVRSITNNLAFNHQAEILVVTARPAKWEKMTNEQLDKFNVVCHGLFMRDNADFRPSTEMKSDVIESLKEEYDIIAAIEDRDDVIEVFRRQGIFCIKPFGVIK